MYKVQGHALIVAIAMATDDGYNDDVQLAAELADMLAEPSHSGRSRSRRRQEADVAAALDELAATNSAAVWRTAAAPPTSVAPSRYLKEQQITPESWKSKGAHLFALQNHQSKT